MIDNQKEIIRIWEEADTSGEQIIFDLLACAVACGEPFYTEMQSHLDRKDKDAMRACVAKYKTLLRGGYSMNGVKPLPPVMIEPEEAKARADKKKRTSSKKKADKPA